MVSKKHPVVKTLFQYFSLTPMEIECYDGEVQPYRKSDYKPIIIYQYYSFIIIITSYILAQVVDLLSPQPGWEVAKGV